jgi:S1-C subfamily serine protease
MRAGRFPRRPLAVLVAGALAVSLAACDPGGGDPPRPVQASPAEGLFARIPEIVREVQPSVVAVHTGKGEGSGVIWSADGVIVTNRHVVAGADRLQVSFADGRKADATLGPSDPRTDLAVIRADRDGLPAASFADRLPPLGELAVAIGNPLGFENSVTVGVVSGLHRAIPGAARQAPSLVDLIQTDAAISPGNSGGALVGPDGKVIGINEAYVPPTVGAVSLGFAIPAPTVVEVVEQLLASGQVRHPYLGVRPAPLTPQLAERFGLDRRAGVLVLQVQAGTPAARAGIRPGDLIVAIDGDQVRTVEDFLGRLRPHQPGDQLTVTVARDGKQRQVDVTLAERPR